MSASVVELRAFMLSTLLLGTVGMPPLKPMQGIRYGRGLDMMQASFEEQWGANGRNDLGVMAKLGANSVRSYFSLGLDVQHVPKDHDKFLDYALDLGLNVMPGYYTRADCPDFDCFETWKAATLAGFQHGFKRESSWHQSIAMLILLNEPDFFESHDDCQPQGPWCRVKAAISALDGVLAAERQAGVSAGRVKFTVTWSPTMRESIDGKVKGPGTFGFQDMVAVIDDPQIAHYNPRTSLGELQEAFKTRWVHGLNTKAPWSNIKAVVAQNYEKFLPVPWFIGEYGGNGQDEDLIRSDFQSIQAYSAERNAFLGAAFFQFQAVHEKGVPEMYFALFGLGEKIADTGEICHHGDVGCDSLDVHCLTTKLSWLPGSKTNRAQAVATAWGGSIDPADLCPTGRRLDIGGVLV